MSSGIFTGDTARSRLDRPRSRMLPCGLETPRRSGGRSQLRFRGGDQRPQVSLANAVWRQWPGRPAFLSHATMSASLRRDTACFTAGKTSRVPYPSTRGRNRRNRTSVGQRSAARCDLTVRLELQSAGRCRCWRRYCCRQGSRQVPLSCRVHPRMPPRRQWMPYRR